MRTMAVPRTLLLSWRCQRCGFSHCSTAAGGGCPTCAANVAALLRTQSERLAHLRVTVDAGRAASVVTR